MSELPEELAGLSEAEDFFEALGVPYDPQVLAPHRLQVMKLYGLALESWLAANPDADAGARRRAMAGALREAHDAFAEEAGPPPCNPFGAGLVKLRRR